MRQLSILIVSLLVLAGCGSSAESDSGEALGDDVVVSSGESEFGQILTTGDGTSLYLLVTDRKSEPTCVEECQGLWSPLTASGATQAEGDTDPSLLSTVGRDDGTSQVTYNGWPLYRYRGDAEPGDIEGHGQLNVWFAVGVHGEAVGPTE